MASGTEQNLRMEIGHVLFVDVVGYSKLLIEEQKERMRLLTDIVLATRPVQEATNEQLVRIPTGDGMALVFRNSLEEPAHCALEISRALKRHPEVQVRMGIHSGPVSEVSDVNARINIAGAGINLAQRVMDCGDAGHILVSRRVAEDLAEYRQWAPHLHQLGKCEVKHGVQVSVTNLFGDDFGNPAVPAKFGGARAGRLKTRSSAIESGPRKFFEELKRRNVYRAAIAYCAVSWLLIQIATQVFPFFDISNATVRWIVIASILGFPIAMLVAWLYELTPEGLVREEDVSPAERKWVGRKMDFIIIGVLALAVALLLFDRFRPSDIPEKSIAVLPFENMTADKENAFFADGIQDEILTSLSKIGDLKVISRTSTLPYRGKTDRNLKQIGEALGVATILEGSVRRVGDEVAVTAQLIDTRNDRHIWAQRYLRTISNALTLQSELAQEIANALHATLSPEEKEAMETKPTDNADAYVLYLRARQYENSPDTLLQDYRAAETLYSDAIKLDPKFALAHAGLSTTCAAIYHYYEPTDARKEKAFEEAREALRLRPKLGEGHLALGLCYYWGERDYERALLEFGAALAATPNDTWVRSLTAAIKRRQGKWPEALEAYERVAALDPQNPNILRNLLYTHTAMRNWEQADKTARRLNLLVPDATAIQIQGAYVDFWWKGSTEALHRTLAEIPAGVDPDGTVTAGRWDVSLIERDFWSAERALEHCSADGVSYLNGVLTHKGFLEGCIALAQGYPEKAQLHFENAREIFEKSVRESPEDATRRANLGLLYAFMGKKEEAIRAGRHAVELMPESKDAVDGAIMNCYLAVIYTWAGEPDQAFPLLERLLQTPGAVDSTLYSVTLGDLRVRWTWDPLRKDPRFERLLAR